MNDEMYNYLLNHNYISFNKTSDKQQELSVERAECIANKCDNLLSDRQQRIDNAISKCKERISYCKEQQSDDEWECCIEELESVCKILEDGNNG